MKCLFKIYDGRKSFWQWDTGQKLIVLDEEIDQVHFATKGMTHALVTEVYQTLDGIRVCTVPDIILQIPRTVIAYAYLNKKDQRNTLVSMQFAVKERPIPDDYVMNQDAEIGQLDERILALEDKVGDKKVVDRIKEVVGNPPERMDTLEEIAKALGNDPDFAANMAINFDRKVDKEEGKGLSSNDFTDQDQIDIRNSIKKVDVDQTFNPISDRPQSGIAIKQGLDEKVDKENGKGLSKNDFTDKDKIKLDSIDPDGIQVGLDGKVDKIPGKVLSSNDFTNEEKEKLGSINPQLIQENIDKKVDKELGKGLSSNDFTNELKSKLEKIDPDATKVEIDETLTISGKAADAKVVGDKLKEKLNIKNHTPNKYLGTDEFGNVVEKEAPSGGGVIDAEGKGDSIIITTSLSVKGDGDSIIIG